MGAPRTILLAVSGASGSVYAGRLLDKLLACEDVRVYLVFSDIACRVVRWELGPRHNAWGDCGKLLLAATGSGFSHPHIKVFHNDDLFAPIASGSARPDSMVVTPCSMGTLARITHGVSSTLIERSADVMLKQRQRLVLAPRETPLSSIHLRNMLQLSEMGCHLIPLMPFYYHHPRTLLESVDSCVGKLLEALELPHTCYPPWQELRAWGPSTAVQLRGEGNATALTVDDYYDAKNATDSAN